MRFLVSNDDGIQSKGLCVLVQLLSKYGEVTVVAPQSQQSAKSSSLTLSTPVIPIEVCFQGAAKAYEVLGTPVDCVKLGIEQLMAIPPDWVITGINIGDNYGQYVYYSGTFGAACEGALNNIPSLAISASKNDKGLIDYDEIMEQLRYIISRIINQSTNPNIIYNINLKSDNTKNADSIKICPLNTTQQRFKFCEYLSPKGQKVYWLNRDDKYCSDDSDLYWGLQGYTTISPIRFQSSNSEDLSLIEKNFDI